MKKLICVRTRDKSRTFHVYRDEILSVKQVREELKDNPNLKVNHAGDNVDKLGYIPVYGNGLFEGFLRESNV